MNLDQLIECPICLSLICEPITLLCGHSFCRICLVKYLSHSQTKRCVSCRSLCNLNPEDAKESLMLKNIALSLKPEQYQAKLNESYIEKNSWKKSIPLYRSLRLDIYPGHDVLFHLFESSDKNMIQIIQNTTKRFACCHYSNQHIAFVVIIKDIQLQRDDSYRVTASVLKNRFVVQSVTDDLFTTGLKVCLLQDLYDDPLSTTPRPWVPLPPTFYTGGEAKRHNNSINNLENTDNLNNIDVNQDENSNEYCESSEVTEVIWLTENLKELVNRYVSFRHRRLNGYRRNGPLPIQEPDPFASPQEYSLWAVGILPDDTVTQEKKYELLTSINTLYRLRECVRLFELSNLKITQPKRLFESLNFGMNYGGTLAGGIIFSLFASAGLFWFGYKFQFPFNKYYKLIIGRNIV